MFKTVNHIGIYTTDRDKAAEFYRDVLGMTYTFELTSESDGIRIAMMELDGLQVEILEDPATKAAAIEGAHSTENHFALQVENIEEACAFLREKGVEMEERGIYGVPRFGSDDVNLKVCFFHGPGGERIELLQYE